MSEERPERCESCRFWEPDADRWKVDQGERAEEGECHRFPMAVVKDVDDWCGEWRAKGDRGDTSLSGDLIPDPDEVRRRLAVVLIEADLLRKQAQVCRRLEKERERLEGQK